MSIGSLVRAAAGPFEKRLCAIYRSVFIDVGRCTAQIQRAIPQGATIVDVGGGDGQVLNYLLLSRPDVRVVMIDLRNQIGIFLEPAVRMRVELHPATSLACYRAAHGQSADVLLVSDVVHHVPENARFRFIEDCVALLNPNGALIIKDVAPGGLISNLSVFADRHITGDKHVSLISPAQLVELVGQSGLVPTEALLTRREHPNYAVAFRRPATAAR